MNKKCAWCERPAVVDATYTGFGVPLQILPYCGQCQERRLVPPGIKADYNMLPPGATRAIVDIFSTCAKGRPHWVVEGTSQTGDLSAAMRHLESHRAGDVYSEEGHLHLAHAAARILMALDKVMRRGIEATVWNTPPDSLATIDAQTGHGPAVAPVGGGGRLRTSTPKGTASTAGPLPIQKCPCPACSDFTGHK